MACACKAAMKRAERKGQLASAMPTGSCRVGTCLPLRHSPKSLSCFVSACHRSIDRTNGSDGVMQPCGCKDHALVAGLQGQVKSVRSPPPMLCPLHDFDGGDRSSQRLGAFAKAGHIGCQAGLPEDRGLAPIEIRVRDEIATPIGRVPGARHLRDPPSGRTLGSPDYTSETPRQGP